MLFQTVVLSSHILDIEDYESERNIVAPFNETNIECLPCASQRGR